MVETDPTLLRPAIDDQVPADHCMASSEFSGWTVNNPGDVITEYRQGCRGDSDGSQSWSSDSTGNSR